MKGNLRKPIKMAMIKYFGNCERLGNGESIKSRMRYAECKLVIFFLFFLSRNGKRKKGINEVPGIF